MNRDELKPCPLCGSDTVQTDLVRWNPVCSKWVVECVRGCETRGPGRDTEDEAIEAWNRRAYEALSAEGDGAYLVWSNEHRAWWGPDRRGYFISIENAGRYSRADAIGIAGAARGGWQKARNPDEIAIPERDAIEQSTHPMRVEAWGSPK